jgi:nucleotide-binding universal stress UspA family protein
MTLATGSTTGDGVPVTQYARKRIVVGVAGGPVGAVALGWALREAQVTGFTLELVHAHAYASAVVGSGGVAELGVEPDESEQILADARAFVRALDRDVEVRKLATPGRPSTVLLARARGAALVVVGGATSAMYATALFGSVSANVAARAPCPVVVVRAPEPLVPEGMPITVGHDGSEPSLRAVRFAFDMAARHQAPLRVVRAWRPDNLLRPGTWEQQHDRHQQRMAESLAQLRERYAKVVVRTAFPIGGAAEALLEESMSARLLVVGSRGIGVGAGLLLGSISQTMLRTACCPLAVVGSG